MSNNIFITGRIYKRSEIHDLYGGNRQAGITPCSKFPYIFIFSSKSGHQHGYEDRWENENVFSYTGEGQLSDMEFVRGNLAIRDHIQNGKRVFLFTAEERSYVKFEAELELIDIDYFEAPDTNGRERNAIRFFFKKIGKDINFPKDDFLLGEDSTPLQKNIPNVTERKGLVTSRVGQGAYRKSILFRWDFKCAVTKYSKKEILIASHIVPWKESTNEERLDVNNGILLSPTYDALFDQHLISFENSGKIILSESLSKTKYQYIGISGKEVISNFSAENHGYLDRHRSLLI